MFIVTVMWILDTPRFVWYNGRDGGSRTLKVIRPLVFKTRRVYHFATSPQNIEGILMKRNYRNYTDEEIILACKCSTSYAQAIRKLGLKPAGGNYKNLQKNIDRLGIEVKHMLHQASNQGKEFVKFESLVTPAAIKKRLISLRGHSCQRCLNSSWLEGEIPLEMEHIDGNNRNNCKDNLLLLCPNCHALTPTYRNRKRN